MPPSIPLSTLRMFEAAARFESFQDAAAQMNVSPSAISQHVGNLEKRLGVQLFTREYRRVRLTRKGQELSQALARGFQIIDNALIAADPLSSEGPVRCAVYQTFASRWLIPRLRTIDKELADISIELETGMHSEKFLKNNCDLSIVVGSEPIQGMRATRLFDEILIPVCASNVATRLNCVDDILKETLIYSSNRMTDWDLWFSKVGLQRPESIRQLVFSNSSLAYEAAAAQAGVTIAQQQFLESYIVSGQLVAPFEIAIPTGRSYFLMEPIGRAIRPSVRLVRDWLLGQAESTTPVRLTTPPQH